NSRKACAVVANPVGTRTPFGSWEIISPRLAFLPPTASTSDILRVSNGTTREVALKRADMVEKLRKLKAALRVRAWRPQAPPMGFLVVRMGDGGSWARWNS